MTMNAIKKAVALYLGDRDRHGRRIGEVKADSDEAYHLSMQVGRETIYCPPESHRKIELLDDGETLLIEDVNGKTRFIDTAAINYIDL